MALAEVLLSETGDNHSFLKLQVLHFTFESAEYSGTKRVFLACAMP
jgi:hypothetical protein